MRETDRQTDREKDKRKKEKTIPGKKKKRKQTTAITQRIFKTS